MATEIRKMNENNLFFFFNVSNLQNYILIVYIMYCD